MLPEVQGRTGEEWEQQHRQQVTNLAALQVAAGGRINVSGLGYYEVSGQL